MSKAIAFITGSWITYCAMVGHYDGAVAILAIYILAVVLDPFELKHKKGTTATNSRAQNK